MKNFKTFIVCSVVLISLNFYGQTFTSDFEESIFESYQSDSLNYNFIEGLCAIDSSMSPGGAGAYKQELMSAIKGFSPKEARPRKEKKRVKQIYDELHDRFFVKYALDSYFTDIFKNGTYNCVTASALYSYAFDELNIPYHIKETPSHVFLIAYPNSLKIYLETTVPGAYGFSVPKESEVQKIVDELIAYKLVTKEEVLAKGYMKFYEEYYYGKAFVDRSALIGMQYYNKGITNLNNANYDEALNNLRKSKVFYSSPLIKPILKSIMYTKVNDLEFNTQDDVDYLIELLEMSNYPKDYSIGNLKSSLYKIIEHDDNDSEFLESTIGKLKTITEEKVRDEAVEYMYEYLARNSATDENLDKALRYCDEVLKLNSDSKIAKEIIEYVCFKKVLLSMYDLKSLETFLEMTETYGFLKSNRRYFISLAHFYGNISLMNYINKDLAMASDYLAKFETVMDGNEILSEVNKKLISDLYLRAGNYYYYKGDYKASYDIYIKGLTYIPDYPDLVKKAAWSKEEL
ncbi:hypothetical protein GSB9_02516 [Flavobacteriaceae bacterium GSB9]|nr:hypothetical protein GSB9_02516 [Flavobacteriaceae bacterium GSB9]